MNYSYSERFYLLAIERKNRAISGKVMMMAMEIMSKITKGMLALWISLMLGCGGIGGLNYRDNFHLTLFLFFITIGSKN